MQSARYDLVVLGSGPAGQKAALAASRHGRRVALVDRREWLGGVSLHTGTIPSKTLREAVLYLTGFRQRSFYGSDYHVKARITMADLRERVVLVIRREMEVLRQQMERAGVDLLHGMGRFTDAHSIEVQGANERRSVEAERVLIACGTRAATNPAIPCDGQRVFTADQLLDLDELPRELIVVGGGVIGLEYASMFAALGTGVTVIEARPQLLEFADREIVETLSYHLRNIGATLRLGERVASVTCDPEGAVVADLESGKRVRAEKLLYAIGRQLNTDTLGLDAIGLEVDARGRLAVDHDFRTQVPHVFSAGDTIGFPSLASAAMEQGRRAGEEIAGFAATDDMPLLPYGIYTIPEISMVGRTEQELTADRVPYEVGRARFAELAKGQMVGDPNGMLKILFDPKTLALHGVHVIGESAAEIVHIGLTAMSLGGTLAFFRDAVFNYPTFAEAYKVAAANGLGRL